MFSHDLEPLHPERAANRPHGPRKPGRALRIWREEHGDTAVLGVFFSSITLLMGGLAVDFNKVMAHRTGLQVTADAVAHAALYTRERNTHDEAIAEALRVARIQMPEELHGDYLRATDITFGRWDRDTQTFTPDMYSKTAVQVDVSRITERQNPVSTSLLRLIGFNQFDVTRVAVFETYQPPCFTEGFVADGIVDLQSNNNYFNGFCVHSNTHVSLNSNNYFEPGTVVSMPDSSEIDLPQSGFETNEGLDLALRDGSYRLRIINQIEEIVADLQSGVGDDVPDYVSGIGFLSIDPKLVTPADLTPGRAHVINCAPNERATMDAGLYQRALIVTNCEVKFQAGAQFQDVVMANTNTGEKSYNAPSGFQLGDNDNCAPGGGAVFVTLGGVDVASDLQMYGSQILAKSNVEFAANANGIQGASILSGGEISGTSNMSMGHCEGEGMEDIFTANYFRLAN